MEQGGILHNRNSRRSPVFLAGAVEVAGKPQRVVLRNFSESGVLIEGDCLPEERETVFFERKELRLRCSVVWVQGRYAGLRFARALKPEEVLRHIPKPKPFVPPNSRRPPLACRPLTTAERKMLETLIDASDYTVGI